MDEGGKKIGEVMCVYVWVWLFGSRLLLTLSR